VVEVLLAEEAELSENGAPAFLDNRKHARQGQQTAQSQAQKRRLAMRRMGVPEHLIDEELAKIDAAREKLLQEAGVKRR
jgi:hypothetical protein